MLVAKWTAKEGGGRRVAELSRRGWPSRRGRSPGAASTRGARTRRSRGTFLIFEIYDDQAAFEAHGASEHFQQIAAGEAFPLLESRERAFYETLD